MILSEQMFPFCGHIPRFTMFMEIAKFTKNVSYLFIDEVHCISTLGTSENGEAAHRPALMHDLVRSALAYLLALLWHYFLQLSHLMCSSNALTVSI
jgi:hypothetical protein